MRSITKKLALTLALILCAAFVLSACAQQPASAPAASAPAAQPAAQPAADAPKTDGDTKSETTLTIALWSEIAVLDPIYCYDSMTVQVLNQITEGVLTIDQNNQLVPMLAESWEQVDDLTYVYNMRSDVKFSDGTDMTMDDVLYSLKRHMNPDLASYLGWMYGNVASIEQTGDWQFTVKLTSPDSQWKYVLSTSAGWIISKADCEAKGDDFGKPAGGCIGTGPFVYESWTPGSQIVISKSPNYWNGADSIAIDKVVYEIIADDTTRMNALVSGQVDMAIEAPASMIDQANAAENLNVYSIDSSYVDFLSFNNTNAYFADQNVRLAIAHAINMDEVYDSLLSKTASKANTLPFGKGLVSFEADNWNAYMDAISPYSYDVALAKEYMAKSAYPNGFDCSLLISESSINNSMALYFQQALSQIGINVSIEKTTNDDLISVVFGAKLVNGSRDYEMAIFRWAADFPDVAGNITPLYYSANAGEGGSDCPEYRNADVDALLDAQIAESDDAKRTEYLQKALDTISADCPMVPLQYPYVLVYANKSVQNFNLNAMWLWNFKVQGITKG